MSKGHKKPKDLNAPKKNQSSYFIYSNERRPVLQLETKGRSVTDISKTISAEWKIMEPETKKIYEEKAAQEKQRYLSAFEVYSKTENYTKYQTRLTEWKENEKLMNRDIKKKGRAPKKPKQPDSMPKRPQSSYFLFSNARRNELRETYPEKKLTELSKLIADEWKLQTATEKGTYEESAAINKEKYNKIMSEYKETDEYKDYQQELDEWKRAKKKWETEAVADGPKVSLPRKPKDDKCPKRPLTSYFLYAKEVREATKEEFPNKSITEIAKEISKKWKVLNEDEKIPYNKEAARLKELYKIAIGEYVGSDAQIQFKQKLEEWKQECNKRKRVAKEKADKKKEKLKVQKIKEKQKRMRMQKQKQKAKNKKKKPTKKTKKKMETKKKSMEVDSSEDDESESDSDESSESESGSSSSSSSGSSSSGSSDNSDDSDSDSDSSSD